MSSRVCRIGYADRLRILCASALAFVLCASQLGAQTITGIENDWKSTAPLSGATWITALNWSLGTLPGSTNTAVFTSTSAASGTITLSGSSVVGIVWKSGASSYTLSDTSGGQITLTLGADGLQNYSGNTQTITGNKVSLTLGTSTFFDVGSSGALTISAGGTTPLNLGANTLTLKGSSTGVGTINSVISGTGSIIKSGTGSWTLSGVNTYTGTTTINGGTLQLGVSSAVPNTAVTVSAIGAGTTATFALSGFNDTIASLTLGGSTTTSGAAVTTGTGTLTLGGDVTYDATNNPLGATMSGNLGLGSATRTFTIGDSSSAAADLTVSAIISGTGGLTKTGVGTLVLSGANTYTGGTNINAGTLSLGSSGALGSSGTISFGGGTLQYSASNTTDYSSRFSTASNQAYSIDTNSQSVTFATALTSSGGTLTKLGSGTLTLSAANTYTGATTISGGTLSLDNAGSTTARLANTSGITVNSGGTLLLASSSGSSNDRISNSATMTLNGGTFNTGGLSEHGASNNTAGIGALTLQSTSIIDMGNSASIVAFANSKLSTWVGTLNIYNWSGTPLTGGGTDQLYFGSDSTGLTAAQLLEIQFYSGTGTGAYGAGALILANGEVVPVPEPSTYIAAILALGAVVFQQRKRVRTLLPF